MLEVSRLQAAYGDIAVLFDVSFTLGRGEALTLLGRNGAGKSTTLKALMRLVGVTGGTVRFEGDDLAGLSTHHIARRGIGYVPEERRIFAAMSVEENLRVTRPFAPARGGWSVARVCDVFPKLGELRRRQAGLLSGGEQQMLAIARTLMGGPQLLLLDEPSEGLAPVVVEALAEQLRRLKAEGITLLLAEQNTRFAAAVSDRVAVIDRGSVVHVSDFDSLRRDSALIDRHLFVATPATAP